MDDIQKVEKLLKKNNGVIETYQVEELGINNKVLTRMIEKGLIERIARGAYIGKDTFEDQYFITQAICRKGIFSHETALYFHDLCDRTPIKYQLTIPSYYNTKLLKDKSYDFFYLKDELYEIGIIEMKTPYGNKIKVYDLERTICDVIKNKNRLNQELVNKALRKYFYSKEKNTLKLYEYAKKMKIYKKVRSVFEILG